MDYITSHTFFFSFLGLYAVVLSALAWSNPRIIGVRWFALSTTLELMKTGLQSLDERAPRVLTVLLANELNMADFVAMYLGYRWFVDKRPLQDFRGLLAVAALMVTYAAMGLLHIHNAFSVMGVVVLGVCAATVATLLRTREPRFRTAAMVTLSLLAVHMLLLLYRVGLSLTLHGAVQSSWRDPRWMYSMLAVMLVGVCLLTTYLWFTAAEITGRVAETAGLDALTGSMNRRALAARAEMEMANSLVQGTRLSVVVLDLDHFKLVNDTYGHSAGDVVLCAVVEKMRGMVRSVDVIARIGGEEFVLLLPGVEVAVAMERAEQLRRAIEETRVEYEGDVLSVTVSAGVTEALGAGDSWGAAFKRADRALYQAKEVGRNRVEQDEKTQGLRLLCAVSERAKDRRFGTQ